MSKRINEKDLFDFPGGEIPSQLPMLTEQEKNRMYKKSERKFSDDTGEIPVKEGNTVSGVERYSRPVWKRRLASVAAAGVLLAGSGGLVYYVKNGTLDGFETATVSDMTSTSDEADHQETAEYLINGYADFRTRFDYPASDKATIVKLNVEGEDIQIARYSDRSINSMADFRELGKKYMTDEYLGNNFDFSEAPDKSGFAEGSSIRADEWYAGNANARFFMYNGELYTYFNEDYSDGSCRWECKDISVSENGADSFKAKALLELYEKKGKKHSETEYEFEVVRSESANEWRINNARPCEKSVQERDTAYDQIALELSDRYSQLYKYIYERPATGEPVTFTYNADGREVETQYNKITDEDSELYNVFWNVHSLNEILEQSYMENELYASLFSRIFAGYRETESIDSVRFPFAPIIIEYRGELYKASMSATEYTYPAQFTDEPLIISYSEDRLVFRRKTSSQSNYAEINSIPMTYQFTARKNSDGKWLISDVVQVNEDAELSFSREEMEAVEKLVLDCNKFGNAICSDIYNDNDDIKKYWLNSEKCFEFRKYVNPDYTSAEQIEEEMNRIFTSELIDSRLFPDKSSYALCTDLDFDPYPDDYIWAVDYAADMMQTPFRYVFVSSKGSIYKNPTKMLSAFPYFPPDAEYETKIAVLDENKVNVSVVYDIPESEYVFNGDTFGNRCTFECIRTPEGWKINDYGTRL